MAKHRIDTITDLMEFTGLSRNAVNKLWKFGDKNDDEEYKEIKSLKLGTLMVICDKFNVKLSELIEYLPENEQN